MRKWSPKKIITLVVSAALLGGTVYYASGFDSGSGDLRPSSSPTVESQPNEVATSKQPDPVQVAASTSKAPAEPTSPYSSKAPQVTSVREVSPTKKVLEETPYKRRTIATEVEPRAVANADDPVEVANAERVTEALTAAPGQWHSYSFDYTDSGSGTQFNGNQTLFYSTIDMRIGFEF